MATSFRDYAAVRDATLSEGGKRLLTRLDDAHRVGTLVRTTRTERGFTQARLSAATGITQADISRIERAQIIPTLPTLLRLLDAMDCSLHVTTD